MTKKCNTCCGDDDCDPSHDGLKQSQWDQLNRAGNAGGAEEESALAREGVTRDDYVNGMLDHRGLNSVSNSAQDAAEASARGGGDLYEETRAAAQAGAATGYDNATKLGLDPAAADRVSKSIYQQIMGTASFY